MKLNCDAWSKALELITGLRTNSCLSQTRCVFAVPVPVHHFLDVLVLWVLQSASMLSCGMWDCEGASVFVRFGVCWFVYFPWKVCICFFRPFSLAFSLSWCPFNDVLLTFNHSCNMLCWLLWINLLSNYLIIYLSFFVGRHSSGCAFHCFCQQNGSHHCCKLYLSTYECWQDLKSFNQKWNPWEIFEILASLLSLFH